MCKEDIKKKIRSDFSRKIIPIIKKQSCEVCGGNEFLVVHHDIPFNHQLDDAINCLGMSYECYNEDILRTYMMGMQIKNRNITLCEDCHKEVHINKHGGFSGCGNTNWDEIKKERQIKKSIALNKKIRDIENFLEELMDKKLLKEDMETISKMFNEISRGDYRSKMIQTSRINKILEENNIPFIFKNRETTKYEEGKRKKVRFKQCYKI